MQTTNFDLTLDEITKIEGAAALDVAVRDGKVTDLKFKITEYKRFYTKGVVGKNVAAVPQFVARICGTCSNAHLIASVKAIESALAATVTPQTAIMRRLAMNGLLIRDHGLHLYVFSLPDIVGRDTILEFDETNERERQLLHDTFEVKAAGNQLSIAFGGRSVHAPFMMLGGFMQFPDEATVSKTRQMLEHARPAVLRLIQEFAVCTFSCLDPSHSVALIGNSGYDFLDGEIHITDQRTIPPANFRNHLEKVIIPYSHATGYRFEGDTFIVGALARLNLGRDLINERTKKDAKEAIGLFPSQNIFHNNLAQAIEILHCIDDSLDILAANPTFPKEPPSTVTRSDGVGIGVIEAPRGTLYHRYDIQNRTVTSAEIIVPTGQNQISIEKNLVRVVEANIDKSQAELSYELEKLVRAYDPCMSCASHFLKVTINRV